VQPKNRSIRRKDASLAREDLMVDHQQQISAKMVALLALYHFKAWAAPKAIATTVQHTPVHTTEHN